MMNSSYPIRFVLVAGMLCALLPGRASSFRDGAEKNLAAGSPATGIAAIPAAQAPAIPVAGSSAVAAADSRVAPVSDSAAGSLPDSLSDASYLTADPMPVFGDGGIEEFRRWVQERLVYPDEALGRGIQGRVVVSFVVERDGTVGGVRTLASPDSLLSEAVIRVVRRSPAWTPGMLEGKPVRVWHSIPVDFTVRADTTGQAAREEVMPEFRGGGLTEFKRWVLRHLELEDDVFFPGDNGWVETEFCINKKGRVRKIDTPRFSDPDFADRIRRAIASAPDWTPAEKPYDVYLRMRFDLLLQRTSEGLRTEDCTAYTVADKLPLFRGRSFDAFRDWAFGRVDSLLGPSVPAPPAVVMVRFVVERDGTVTDMDVGAPGKYGAFAKLVRRAIDDIPLWSPAELAGEKVRFRVTQLLDFREAEAPGKRDSTAMLDADPEFCGGGLLDFRRWVEQTAEFPPETLGQCLHGLVAVAFVVETDGSVSSAEVLQSPDSTLSREVVRVVRQSPRWTPGRKNGRPVAVRFVLPVDYRRAYPLPPAAKGVR
ncbi:MAG: TonB family protein [Alistipes shahii]|nr:TonB family protein [Alistipes shahii]